MRHLIPFLFVLLYACAADSAPLAPDCHSNPVAAGCEKERLGDMDEALAALERMRGELHSGIVREPVAIDNNKHASMHYEAPYNYWSTAYDWCGEWRHDFGTYWAEDQCWKYAHPTEYDTLWVSPNGSTKTRSLRTVTFRVGWRGMAAHQSGVIPLRFHVCADRGGDSARCVHDVQGKPGAWSYDVSRDYKTITLTGFALGDLYGFTWGPQTNLWLTLWIYANNGSALPVWLPATAMPQIGWMD